MLGKRKEGEDLTAAKELLKDMWKSQMTSQSCTFCTGKGHHAKECSSKKKLDKIASSNKTWKAAWGTIKGYEKRKRITKACEKGAAGRKKILGGLELVVEEEEMELH